MWKLIIETCEIVEQVTLHYVPSHENIIGNELADKYAKKVAEIHNINTQNNIPIPLSNLNSYLKQQLIKEWCQSKSNENNMSFREIVLSYKTSNLKNRINTPRQLQTLFSRYRYDRSEIVGKYSRKLKMILDPSCRLCNSCEESIYHLLECCLGTLQYRR